MNEDEHRARHEALHEALDELAADYLVHERSRTLSHTSVMELLTWSHGQCLSPRDPELAVDAHRDIDRDARRHSRFLNMPGSRI